MEPPRPPAAAPGRNADRARPPDNLQRPGRLAAAGSVGGAWCRGVLGRRHLRLPPSAQIGACPLRRHAPAAGGCPPGRTYGPWGAALAVGRWFSARAFGAVEAAAGPGPGRIPQPPRATVVASPGRGAAARGSTGLPDPDPARPGHHDRLCRRAHGHALPRRRAAMAIGLADRRGSGCAAAAASPTSRLPATAARDLPQSRPGPAWRWIQLAPGPNRGWRRGAIRPGLAAWPARAARLCP